ncbi:MAG TPA: hypothetical protein VFW34_08565 [Candidatus Rubrimentiphilum sp.]|nr:hypothetical protein [Candidatus Rubrimentiphilum sp.]
MFKRAALFLLLAAIALPAIARADQNPTYFGPLSPAESAFVKAIQADLVTRFPTAQDAERAGYVRYTDADNTGAISYANFHWTSSDAKHPSQLWYDKNGNLLGADFSVLQTGGVRPSIFGTNPGRLYAFDDHVHWVEKNPDGTMLYDKWVDARKYRAAGGDPAHPTAAQLVVMGRAKNASNIVTVFDMPSIWDLIVWVKPNPNGAFAEKNPLVTP